MKSPQQPNNLASQVQIHSMSLSHQGNDLELQVKYERALLTYNLAKEEDKHTYRKNLRFIKNHQWLKWRIKSEKQGQKSVQV